MIVNSDSFTVKWEKLPADYVLPDDPVDNITQPMLAMALTESLGGAGQLSETTLTTTNYGICATINDKMVVKAPDWSFIPRIYVPRVEVERSYTPQLQGEIPTIVMEFLSETAGEEFSMKRSYPPGKWFFYERVLKVPNYAIFDSESGGLEVNHLDRNGIYQPQLMDENLRYWIPEMKLFLGVWQGTKEERSGYWLRWWNESGQLLLWGAEAVEQERQRADTEQERSRRLADKLRELGVDPTEV